MFTIWSYWPHTGVRTSDPGAMNFKILLKEFMDIIIMHFFFFPNTYYIWEQGLNYDPRVMDFTI